MLSQQVALEFHHKNTETNADKSSHGMGKNIFLLDIVIFGFEADCDREPVSFNTQNFFLHFLENFYILKIKNLVFSQFKKISKTKYVFVFMISRNHRHFVLFLKYPAVRAHIV